MAPSLESQRDGPPDKRGPREAGKQHLETCGPWARALTIDTQRLDWHLCPSSTADLNNEPDDSIDKDGSPDYSSLDMHN
ncbi:hypothetical protein SKAU_G00041580 [Synaphobranchus kaupii]|uniref:Uncharacterized protein n=1 Tax=Synaphobranchus kaupii TaxID=118154 RepID=A0A9Q1J8J0_SYNKA|nr:hypothetical protein SKAU_G00041580 [Synaphobranchus kaupii]